MTRLSQWAARWVPPALLPAALTDLQRVIQPPTFDPPAGLYSEAGAQVAVRLAASREGILNWRNNTGALADANGRFVRFGLANDTPAMNAHIKMGDLVGIRPLVVTQAHVGQMLGIFWMREVKHPGWRMPRTPSAREKAQLAAIELVLSRGGDAAFTTGEL
jgi:hypothetical protein